MSRASIAVPGDHVVRPLLSAVARGAAHACRNKLAMLAFVACVGAGHAAADSPSITQAYTVGSDREVGDLVSDRPDFTESSSVIPAGWFQWEGGIAAESNGVRGRGFTFGNPLLRVGVGPKIELRLSSSGLSAEHRQTADATLYRWSAVEVGLKYRIAVETRRRPAFSLIGSVTAPSGEGPSEAGTWAPTLKFICSKAAGGGFSVAGNINRSYQKVAGRRVAESAASVSVGHDLGKRVAMYWEVYGFTGTQLDPGAVAIVATGITRAIGTNAQWDLTVGRRLSSLGPDWVASTGWVVRAPFRSMLRFARDARNVVR